MRISREFSWHRQARWRELSAHPPAAVSAVGSERACRTGRGAECIGASAARLQPLAVGRQSVSLADVIVLGGCAGVRRAGEEGGVRRHRSVFCGSDVRITRTSLMWGRLTSPETQPAHGVRRRWRALLPRRTSRAARSAHCSPNSPRAFPEVEITGPPSYLVSAPEQKSRSRCGTCPSGWRLRPPRHLRPRDRWRRAQRGLSSAIAGRSRTPVRSIHGVNVTPSRSTDSASRSSSSDT